MGFFDNNKEVNTKIKALEKSIQNLINTQKTTNDSILKLKNDLIESTKRSPEYEKVAQESSKKTSEFRNKANGTFDEIKTILEESKTTQAGIYAVLNNIKELEENSNSSFDKFKIEYENINNLITQYNSRIEAINENIELFENTIENHPDFEDELSDLENFILKVKENENKSNQLIKTITNRKIELETVYNQILGYNEENEETGKVVKVNGIRQNLLESLDGLDDKVLIFQNDFETLKSSTKQNITELLKDNNDKITSQILGWENKYKELKKEIEALLPQALTAGLSSAFSAKRDNEVTAYEDHKTQFRYGIIGMILVSLIPFIISLISLCRNEELDIIVNRAPKLAIAILPLYIPVLWFSYSSSKKMSLSKRLIEEYSHKEVLSKTYEGLSKQIQDVEENSISKELRIKLLQDFLQMYSENPGKLITDYNKSDHPIMELLEDSNRIEKTISKLENIPGLNKVVRILEEKQQKKIIEANDSINEGLKKAIALNEKKEGKEEDNTTEV